VSAVGGCPNERRQCPIDDWAAAKGGCPIQAREVEFSEEYPIGTGVHLVRVGVGNMRCSCAARDEE
jgi:hypothetical protein